MAGVFLAAFASLPPASALRKVGGVRTPRNLTSRELLSTPTEWLGNHSSPETFSKAAAEGLEALSGGLPAARASKWAVSVPMLIMAAALVLVLLATAVRIAVTLPARLLCLRTGPLQMAASVAVIGVIVALFVSGEGAAPAGRTAAFVSDLVSSNVGPPASAAWAQASAWAHKHAGWILDIKVVDSLTLRTPEAWLLVMQFGLVAAAAASTHLVGIAAVVGAFGALEQTWGGKPILEALA